MSFDWQDQEDLEEEFDLAVNQPDRAQREAISESKALSRIRTVIVVLCVVAIAVEWYRGQSSTIFQWFLFAAVVFGQVIIAAFASLHELKERGKEQNLRLRFLEIKLERLRTEIKQPPSANEDDRPEFRSDWEH